MERGREEFVFSEHRQRRSHSQAFEYCNTHGRVSMIFHIDIFLKYILIHFLCIAGFMCQHLLFKCGG